MELAVGLLERGYADMDIEAEIDMGIDIYRYIDTDIDIYF